ncbi:MAG: PIG-L family deacetylase [Tissierellia bacterium]|nr:PIG-L family deacetylase [Tissierellia bacterium]
MLKKFIKIILKYPVTLFNSIFLYLYYTFSHKGIYKKTLAFSHGKNKVLFMAPHVDDESIGVGATLLKHGEKGDTIIGLYMADGGGAVSSLDKESLIQLRKEEAHTIKNIIGIEQIYFLDIPDGQVMVREEYVDRVYSILVKESPDIIYMPFLLDGHIDHVNSSRILIESIKRWDSTFNNIFMYSVNTPIRPDLINTVTIMDKNLFDKKNTLYDVFKSQYVMGFDAFESVNRALRLLVKEGYALEGFVKGDLDRIIEFNNILIEEGFNPSQFRQLSSRYNLFFSYMKNKKLKDSYMDIFKDLLLITQEA